MLVLESNYRIDDLRCQPTKDRLSNCKKKKVPDVLSFRRTFALVGIFDVGTPAKNLDTRSPIAEREILGPPKP